MKTRVFESKRILVAVFVIGVIFAFVYYLRVIVTPFFLGFLLAYILEPLVSNLERKKISRTVAISLIYLGVAVAFGLLVVFAVPLVLKDLNRIVEMIPSYTQELQMSIREVEVRYNRIMIPEGIREVMDNTILRIEKGTLSIFQGFATALVGLFSQAFNLVLAPVLGFYFLLEYNSLGQWFQNLAPARYRHELQEVGIEIKQIVTSFIRGNFLVSLLVALISTIGMFLIRMDFPVLIGMIVGVTNFIPYFGALIAVVVAVFLALLRSKWLALYVFGIMLLIQQIEGNILAPRILGECIGLHPLAVIFALLAGGHLWGVGGMLLAVPLAGIIKVLLGRLYLHLI